VPPPPVTVIPSPVLSPVAPAMAQVTATQNTAAKSHYGVYPPPSPPVLSSNFVWRSLGSLPAGWNLIGAADFDGDGNSDLICEHANSGERGIWLMKKRDYIGWISFGGVPVQWRIVGAGDFDNSGTMDLVWQNNVTGTCTVSLFHSTGRPQWTSIGTFSTDWKIVGVHDFDNNGSPDLVFENHRTGLRGIWLTKVGAVSGEGWVNLGFVDLNWHVAGTGDFDGNGTIDLVWQNTATGQCGVWIMGAVSSTSPPTRSWRSFGKPGAEWLAANK
jgi:serralysin